jgi:hypothetical protein
LGEFGRRPPLQSVSDLDLICKKERERESYVFFFVVVGLPCDSSLPGDL